jgi:hypothetical protein
MSRTTLPWGQHYRRQQGAQWHGRRPASDVVFDQIRALLQHEGEAAVLVAAERVASRVSLRTIIAHVWQQAGSASRAVLQAAVGAAGGCATTWGCAGMACRGCEEATVP